MQRARGERTAPNFRSPDGKQVYVGASKYYKEAFRKLEAARKLKQQGKYKREPKAAVRLSEWLTHRAETYKKPFVVEKTYKDILGAIEHHILPNIPNKDISKVTSLDIQECLNAIGKSRTKESVHTILKNAFEKAYKTRLIRENPVAFVEYKKHKRETRETLTKEQQQEYLQVIETSRFKSLFLFYLYTGTRKAEPLLSLWSDVHEKENTFIVRGTKTDTSQIRPMPLYDELKELLHTLRSESNGEHMAESAYTLTATITPDDASNKAVDWSVAFVNPSSAWATGKTVTDYVTVTPTSDGALTANVECKQAFGEQIVVTVVSRDNAEATATCTVDYAAKVVSLQMDFQ